MVKAKMNPGTSAPRQQSARNQERRVAPRARNNCIKTFAASGILDGVCDQHDGRWIRYGTRQRAIWFRLADLIGNASAVFSRLASIGAPCLTLASQTALKREVEAYGDYREALVASRPGWLEGFYVFGDGTFVEPNSDKREVIVAFAPSRMFTPKGSLKEWQDAVGPFVTEQPLPYFVLCLALTGPLLRFAPPGYLNPQVEIVGGKETGKTTLGVLAASVWAGNPDSDCGGGVNWDTTLNAIDDVKLARRDGFLFSDEGNLAGAGRRNRQEFAEQAVFKMAATGGKRRLGDAVDGEHARLTLLSTSNTALADLIGGRPEVMEAAQSRMITIRIEPDAPHGVFETLPEGYASGRAMSEALVAKTNLFWGAACEAFIWRLVDEIEHDEGRLRNIIAKELNNYIRLDTSGVGSARVQKTYAIVAVAAAMARQWGVLPKAWGSPLQMVQAVAHAARRDHKASTRDPAAEIAAYVQRHRSAIGRVADIRKPLSKTAFEASAGFLREARGGIEVLIPAARFQETFSHYEMIMRVLRAEGLAQTEGGHAPKLTIKTPRAICAEGRVYCIQIDRIQREQAPREQARPSEREPSNKSA